MIFYWFLLLVCVCVGQDDLYDGKLLVGEVEENLLKKLELDPIRDLSADSEYEDLRAELKAYHSALRSLVENAPQAAPKRRSMKTTPCWELGGICIHKRMCAGERFLTQVRGCMNQIEVCCFTWNKFKPRDLSGHGLPNSAYPWSVNNQKFGGKGVLVNGGGIKKKKPKKLPTVRESYIKKAIDSMEYNKPKYLESATTNPKSSNERFKVSKEAVSQNVKNISLRDALERILNDESLRQYIS